MNSYLKITGRTFTIWVLASFINGLLCGISLSSINHIYNEITGDILGIFFISLFFSVPGFFVFWIVLLLGFASYTAERALFRLALITGFILAAVTAYFGSNIFSSEFNNYSFIPAACIVLSTLSSIMFHFKHFKKIK